MAKPNQFAAMEQSLAKKPKAPIGKKKNPPVNPLAPKGY